VPGEVEVAALVGEQVSPNHVLLPVVLVMGGSDGEPLGFRPSKSFLAGEHLLTASADSATRFGLKVTRSEEIALSTSNILIRYGGHMVAYEPDSLPEAELAQRLRGLRAQRRWSQADLAQLMSDGYGLRWHQTTIAKIEAGQRPIGLNEAAALAQVFEIPGSELLMPFLGRRDDADELRAREDELRARSAAVERELISLIEQQTAARQRVQTVSEERERAVRRIEALAAALRDITEQYEDAQKQHQDLSARLEQGITELVRTENAVGLLRERSDFHRAELDQVRMYRRQERLQALREPRPESSTHHAGERHARWTYAVAVAMDGFPAAEPQPTTADWHWEPSTEWGAVQVKCFSAPTRTQDPQPIEGALIEKFAERIATYLADDVHGPGAGNTTLEFILAVPVKSDLDHDRASAHLRKAASEILAKCQGARDVHFD
jgi:transcriptional regulator with XRE-family HTH domain